MIRVLYVDDHFIAREGLRSIISCEEGMTVAGEAANGEEALALYPSLLPDVTLMDVRLPGRNGIETVRQIRKDFPQSRFVVLTSHDGDELVHKALDAGVQGYLYKEMVRIELTNAIRVVHSGRCYLPTPVASQLFGDQPRADLTPRELDVLRSVAAGKSNKVVAKDLRITESTVKAHVQNLLAKLGASDRTHAVTIAGKRGILI